MSQTMGSPPLPCLHKHRPLAANPTVHETDGHHHLHEFATHRPKQRRALLVCVVLTTVTMGIEAVAGFLTGSLMLISDAIHMLSHSAALGTSYLAILIASKNVDDRLSFGLYRVEVLAAFINGIALAGFSFWIVYEGIDRLMDPPAILGPAMTAVAMVGLAVNLTTAAILHRSGLEDINTKSAFLHMLADTFSSIGIVTGGVVILLTDWYIVDPILSIVVAAVVAKWSWGLLRESTLILLERKPQDIDLKEMEKGLMETIEEIKQIHDIHVWEITSQYICLSAHIVLDDMKLSETAGIRSRVESYVKRNFNIGHIVIHLEC